MKEILLSMKPEWFNMAILGKKLYEYRKRFPNEEIRAYIYVSSPVKSIEAIFDLGKKIDLKELLLDSNISTDMMDGIKHYLKNNNYAVPIKKVYRTNRVTLDDLRLGVERFVAPQMYYILKDNSELTRFIHENVRIIGQSVCDNTVRKVSENEFCKVFEQAEVVKLKQLSLFDDPNFFKNEAKKTRVITEKDIEEIHPRLVSLFSGCGGMDLGFLHAGFNIIYANDFDSDAQRVYEKNFGSIDKRSILDVNEKEIPDCDILTAGFPCQPFSNAGNRKGVNDSRGNLYKECLRIINEKNLRL